jgi:RimJ/RimL family protein N-acetyltransferase
VKHKIVQTANVSNQHLRQQSDRSESVAGVYGGIELEKAGLLDTPLIFRLMLKGSITGSFTDRYLQDAGHLSLLAWILRALIQRPRWMRRHSGFAETLILRQGELEIGFIQLAHSTPALGEQVTTIELFAIAKAHQNQGLGSCTVAALMTALPPNAVLVAYCTKYSRAMQHVLTKLHFKRGKPMHGNLTRFSWQKSLN